MKITMNNIGAVDQAELTLKPLTIFVGENGTGKTWTAYAIAGIFGTYGFEFFKKEYLEGGLNPPFDEIERARKALEEKGSAELNIVRFANEFIETYLNGIAGLAPKWLNKFLATKRANFKETNIRIEIQDDIKRAMADVLTNSAIKAEKSIGKTSAATLNALKKQGSETLYYYAKSDNGAIAAIPEPIIMEEIRDFVFSLTLNIVRESLFSSTVILPTERSIFITLPFPSNKTTTSHDHHIEKKDKAESWNDAMLISEPFKNCMSMLKSSFAEYYNRKMEAEREPKIIRYMQLANLLEKEILLGHIDFEQQGNNVELVQKLSERTSLEINISSSMVKELAPLALYLKYLARPGDLLIIDEPEMNLHPVAQAEIIEFLCMLSNAGLHVLITTHSPYIVDHLVNLMHCDMNEKCLKIKEDLFLERADAFISRDNVAVYLFENNTVRNILREDKEIEWDTFSDISREISSIYAKLTS